MLSWDIITLFFVVDGINNEKLTDLHQLRQNINFLFLPGEILKSYLALAHLQTNLCKILPLPGGYYTLFQMQRWFGRENGLFYSHNLREGPLNLSYLFTLCAEFIFLWYRFKSLAIDKSALACWLRNVPFRSSEHTLLTIGSQNNKFLSSPDVNEKQSS